eukprot:GHVH01010001.1.p1 GENE.GHVH01010001.1~~GHVH01010001.1.p1  ORF type:complete len:1023 (+),score=158.70 GHVH01010001.1:407-3070(+)
MLSQAETFDGELNQISGGMEELITKSQSVREDISRKSAELVDINEVINKIVPTPGFTHGILHTRMEDNIKMGKLIMAMHMKLYHTSRETIDQSKANVNYSGTAISTLPDLLFLKYLIIGRIRDFLLELLEPLDPRKGVFQSFQRNLSLRYHSYFAYLAAYHPNSAWVFKSNYQLKMQRVYSHQVSLYTRLLQKRLDPQLSDIKQSSQLNQVIFSSLRTAKSTLPGIALAIPNPSMLIDGFLSRKTVDDIETVEEASYPNLNLQMDSLYNLLAAPAPPVVHSNTNATQQRGLGWTSSDGNLTFTEILRSALTLIVDTATFEVLILKRLFWIADRPVVTWVSDELSTADLDDSSCAINEFEPAKGQTDNENAPLTTLSSMMSRAYRVAPPDDPQEVDAASRAGDLAAFQGVRYSESENTLNAQVHMAASIWGPAFTTIIELVKSRFVVNDTRKHLDNQNVTWSGEGGSNLLEIVICYRITESFGQLLRSRQLGLLAKRLIEPILNHLVTACRKVCTVMADLLTSILKNPRISDSLRVIKNLSHCIFSALFIVSIESNVEEMSPPKTVDCQPSDDDVRRKTIGEPIQCLVGTLDKLLGVISMHDGSCGQQESNQLLHLSVLDHFLGVIGSHILTPIFAQTSCDEDGKDDLDRVVNPNKDDYGACHYEIPFRISTGGDVAEKLRVNVVHPTFKFTGNLTTEPSAVSPCFLKLFSPDDASNVEDDEPRCSDVWLKRFNDVKNTFPQDTLVAWLNTHVRLSEMVVDAVIKQNIGSLCWLTEISRAAISLYDQMDSADTAFDKLLMLARAFKEDLPAVTAGLLKSLITETSNAGFGQALFRNATCKIYVLNMQLANIIDIWFEQYPEAKERQLMLLEHMISSPLLMESLNLHNI